MELDTLLLAGSLRSLTREILAGSLDQNLCYQREERVFFVSLFYLDQWGRWDSMYFTAPCFPVFFPMMYVILQRNPGTAAWILATSCHDGNSSRLRSFSHLTVFSHISSFFILSSRASVPKTLFHCTKFWNQNRAKSTSESARLSLRRCRFIFVRVPNNYSVLVTFLVSTDITFTWISLACLDSSIDLKYLPRYSFPTRFRLSCSLRILLSYSQPPTNKLATGIFYN